MSSTATLASRGAAVKNVKPTKDFSRVENIRDLTKEQLEFFPFLKEAPDIMYWLMATWGAESGWNLFHPKGRPPNQVFNSLHYTATPPQREAILGLGPISSRGTLIGNGYQYSDVIQNLWNDPTTSVQVRENIKEGWYPHGITACMGTYHVRGCYNNLGEWRFYPEAVERINALGLEVDPGQSISQTLFPVDDDVCRRRSIASGMIIFNFKYRQALKTNGPNGAIQVALATFLGKLGTQDANGVTPEMRVRQLNARGGDIVSVLQAVNLRRSGETVELSRGLVSLDDRQASDRAATRVVNTPARPATTNSQANGQSAKTPGCSVT